MKAVDLHPEDLLDKYYGGGLSAPERQRLDRHLAACAPCRFELTVGMDLEAEEHPRTPIDTLVLGAMGSPRERQRGAWWLAGLAAALLAGSAAAQWVAGAQPSRSELGRFAQPPRPRPISPPGAVGPGEEATPPELPSQRSTAPSEPSAGLSDSASPTPDSATHLFERANAARRKGRAGEAIRLYRLLQERFAGSAEARLSHQVVARMKLDDAPEASLEEYDRYLESQGRLGEEALVGRAAALARLDRVAEERAVWQELLARYPDSIHVPRARARLAALASSRPDE